MNRMALSLQRHEICEMILERFENMIIGFETDEIRLKQFQKEVIDPIPRNLKNELIKYNFPNLTWEYYFIVLNCLLSPKSREYSFPLTLNSAGNKQKLFRMIENKATNLTTLKLSGIKLQEQDHPFLHSLFCKLTKLQHVEFICSEEFFFRYMLGIFQNLPNQNFVKSLRIPSNLSPKLIACILLNLPSLESLGECDIHPVLECIKHSNLELNLKIVNDTYTSMVDFRRIKRFCPNLQTLNLTLPDMSVMPCLYQMKNLTKLSLSNFSCPLLMEALQNNINSFVKLKVLFLENGTGDLYINQFLKLCPELSQVICRKIIYIFFEEKGKIKHSTNFIYKNF